MSADNWTTQQVADWITSCGCTIGSQFQQYKIDGKVLMMITYEDLKEISELSLGERIKLWHKIQKLRRETEITLKKLSSQ